MSTRTKGSRKGKVEEVEQEDNGGTNATATAVAEAETPPQEIVTPTTVAATPTPAKPEVRYSLTKACSEEFGRKFVTTVPDRERGGVIQYVDVPKNMFYFLSQKVGRPLDIADVFGPIVQIGAKVKSAAPSLDREGNKVYMEIDEFSCTLLDIRHFDEWPEFPGGVVTSEYVDMICQRWAEGHPLAGTPRRLGRYLLSKTKGPQPFHGRIFAPDWDARARFDHQRQQDPDWMGGWMFSTSPKSALGRAVNKMMSVLRRDDIIPMPKEDVAALLEAVRNRPASQRSQIDDDLDDILGLGGDEDEDDRGGGYRRDKRQFQGGSRGYRHPR